MTLTECLAQATTYWTINAPSSAKVQSIRAGLGVSILGGTLAVSHLAPSHGVTLLNGLTKAGLSRKSVADYYGAFKRMLFISGVPSHVTCNWPKPGVAPRHNREGLSQGDFERMAGWFHERSEYQATWDLVRVLNATGLRIHREALTGSALRYRRGDRYDTLTIEGKGGHRREVPVVCPYGRAVLQDETRLQAVHAIPYKTHLWRFNQAVKALGINSKLATPHALRHKYATEALERSGGNLALVQELLGHSSPGTTARYVKIDLERTLQALGAAPLKDPDTNEDRQDLPLGPAGP